MSFFSRILGVEPVVDEELETRAKQTTEELTAERQEYRQTIQRLESGVRVMKVWNGAMGMLKE